MYTEYFSSLCNLKCIAGIIRLFNRGLMLDLIHEKDPQTIPYNHDSSRGRWSQAGY